jgi:hypothetical protein
LININSESGKKLINKYLSEYNKLGGSDLNLNDIDSLENTEPINNTDNSNTDNSNTGNNNVENINIISNDSDIDNESEDINFSNPDSESEDITDSDTENESEEIDEFVTQELHHPEEFDVIGARGGPDYSDTDNESENIDTNNSDSNTDHESENVDENVMEASDTRVDSSEQDASVNNELETTSEQSNDFSVPVDSFNRSDINLHENTRDIDKSKMDNYTENLGANKEICESLYNYSDLNDLTWNYFEIVNKNSIYFNTNTDTNQRFQNERNGSGGLIIRNKFNISTGDKIPQELHQLFDSFPMYTYIPGTIDTKLQLLKKNILSEQPNHSDIDETILSSSSVPITNENNNKHLLYTPFEIGLEVFDDEQVDENTGKSLVLPDSNWVEDRIFGDCIVDSFED